MKKIYIVIAAVFLVSLFVGYAAGRGYKTYEINLEKGLSATTPVVSYKEIFGKEDVNPEFYAPRILSVTSSKDPQNGYNIQINTAHFKFTPDNLGKELEQNTGFAYIYVNDQAVGRTYTNNYHIPEHYFKTGTNTVSITLQGNNYKTWWSKKGTLEARFNLNIVN